MSRPDGAVPESGSHRDNWLIRRFVALEAWPEAEAEFARMWKLHTARRPTESYFALALQFTLDYSFFLKQRNQPDRAVAVLEEQTLRLDLDRLQGYNGLAGGGITAASFLNAAYGEFVAAGREQPLLETLEQDSRPARNRVVAWILLHRGETAAALAKELDYIEGSGWGELSKAFRRGALYEEFKRPAEAAAQYEKALSAGF